MEKKKESVKRLRLSSGDQALLLRALADHLDATPEPPGRWSGEKRPWSDKDYSNNHERNCARALAFAIYNTNPAGGRRHKYSTHIVTPEWCRQKAKELTAAQNGTDTP